MAEDDKKFKSILTSPEIKAEYIYEKDLSFSSIRSNPILKPISEINKHYSDLHITATKSIIEFEEEYKKLQQLEEINPRYTNTVLMSTIKTIINLLKNVIHSQDLCDISMKNTINEMIDICSTNYELIEEDKDNLEIIRKKIRAELEEEYKTKFLEKKSDEIPRDKKTEEIYEDAISDLKKIAEGEITKEEKPKKIYSSLLERDIEIK